VNQPSEANTDVGTFDQRLAAVHDELRTEALAPTDEANGDASSQPAADAAVQPITPPPAAPAADSDDAQKRAAERRARLDALKAQERDAVARSSEKTRYERELEALKREAEEAKARAAKLVDLDGIDEPAFFALAQKKGIRPERLADWIRESMTNPERVAEAAALQATRAAVDPKLSALEKQIAEQNAMIQQLLAQQHQAQAAAEERRATEQFLGMVRESSAQAPLASKLLETDPDEFMQMAEVAASRVPGRGPQALLDALEELLDSDGRALAQKYASLYGLTSNVPAATTLPRSAAAKATTTVSNALAQQRASVVEEDDWSSLPFDERVARIKASRG